MPEWITDEERKERLEHAKKLRENIKRKLQITGHRIKELSNGVTCRMCYWYGKSGCDAPDHTWPRDHVVVKDPDAFVDCRSFEERDEVDLPCPGFAVDNQGTCHNCGRTEKEH